MKSSALFFVLSFTLVILHLTFKSPHNNLKAGDIKFIGFNAVLNDSFSVKILADIPSNTTIQFTDSEWNGSKFGLDEGNMIWNSGNEIIKAGTVVHFSNHNEQPKVSVGVVNQALKISKNAEAIFAYIGSERVPKRFLAAMANDGKAYGTLNNTGLKEGVTAITFSNNLCFSKQENFSGVLES